VCGVTRRGRTQKKRAITEAGGGMCHVKSVEERRVEKREAGKLAKELRGDVQGEKWKEERATTEKKLITDPATIPAGASSSDFQKRGGGGE